MNRRATIVLLLVAILLAGFLVLTRSGTLTIGDEDEDAEGEDSPSFDPLFEEAQGDVVVSFSITDEETGDRFAAEAGEAGWTVTETAVEPEEGQVLDGFRLDNATSSLTGMVTSRQLTEIENLTQYGLDSARYTLVFNTGGGGEFTLFIGGQTPGEGSYYTQRPGDQGVNLVSAAVLDTFIEFLSAPPYAEPTPTPEPTAEGVPVLTPVPTP